MTASFSGLLMQNNAAATNGGAFALTGSKISMFAMQGKPLNLVRFFDCRQPASRASWPFFVAHPRSRFASYYVSFLPRFSLAPSVLNNVATAGMGGAVYFHSSIVQLSGSAGNADYDFNTAVDGGAIACVAGTDYSSDNIGMTSNSASNRGGGFFSEDSMVSFSS